MLNNPGPLPDRHRSFEYDWKHPLVWIAIISFFGAVIGLISLAFSPSVAITLLSSLLTLIASSLISHLITYSSERRQFARQLAKLSAFAKRRVNILCTDLNLLYARIEETPDLEDAKLIVQYALKNLEQDARASVRDIEEMRRIDEDDRDDDVTFLSAPPRAPDAAATVQLRSTATVQLRSPTETGMLARAGETVTYDCPNCNYANSANLGHVRGFTTHSRCASCHTRVALHRLATGAIRVVDLEKTGAKPLVSRQHSLTQFFSARPKVLPARMPATAKKLVVDSFTCPRCQYHIQFSASSDQRTVEKPCFSCLAVISFDRQDRMATVVSSKRPAYIDSIDVGSMTCLTCQKEFYPKVFKSLDGKRFICCFACNTIYLPTSYMKTAIQKTCPTDGCGNLITFKISQSEPDTRQFCFECMSRLLYTRSTDEVTALEKLQVPRLTFAEFQTGGQLCPHCHHLASSKYMRNSRGQKISICWNCKGIFELSDASDEPPAAAAAE